MITLLPGCNWYISSVDEVDHRPHRPHRPNVKTSTGDRITTVGGVPTKSPTTPTALEEKLIEPAMGSRCTAGISGSSSPVGETVGVVGGTVGGVPTVESTKRQGFQGTVGEIGAVGENSKKFNPKDG